MFNRLKKLFFDDKSSVPDFTSKALLELIVHVSQIVNSRESKPNYEQIAASYATCPNQREFLANFGTEFGNVNEKYDDLVEQEYRSANSWFKYQPDNDGKSFFLFILSLSLGVGGVWGLINLFNLVTLSLPILVLSHIFVGGYLTLRIFEVLMVGPITYFRVNKIENNRQREINLLVDKYYTKMRLLPDNVKIPELEEQEKYLIIGRVKEH